MGKKSKLFLAALVLMACAGFARAMVAKYNTYLVNEAGLTYNKNYPLPLNSYGIDNLSFTTIVTSVTFANSTFTDGQVSTGSITVTTTTGLGALAAFDFLTVVATVAPTSAIAITLNGVTISNLVTPFEDITTTATAINIQKLLSQYVPNATSTSAASNVYSTATVAGSYGNNMTFSANVSTNVISFNTYTSSTPSSSFSQFSGGQDAARLSINGINIPFTTTVGVGGSSMTAASIVNSINTNSSLNTIIIATNNTTGTIVLATSTVVGSFTNYIITSSTDAALTVGGATKTVTGLNGASIGQMWGGKDSAFSLFNGSATVFNITNHGFTLGLPVLFTTTTFQPAGLVGGTTYYVVPVTANSISLSATSTGAVAGTPLIVITSSKTPTTADSFTLAPLAITGTPSIQWQVSNDAITWTNLTATIANVTVSSISYGSYNSTGTVNTWDFGPIDYAFIRLQVVSPTAGAIKIQTAGNGKTEGQFQ